MQEYPILTNWLQEDIQDPTPILPEFVVVHSTANPGASDEDHVTWLNQKRQAGWANYYLDWDSIRQVVPEGQKAPAQGPTYNAKAISLEMCEPSQKLPWDEQLRRFHETWDRATWLVAERCHAYGWGVDQVKSHADVSRELPAETDHTDPIDFFKRYGRTWDVFLSEVQYLLNEVNGALPKAAQWQEQYITDLMQAGLITQRRHPMQTVTWWEFATMLLRVRAK